LTAVVGGFVLPMMLGCLGGCAYALRRLDGKLTNWTLEPQDGKHALVRVGLAALLGGLVGVIWTTDQNVSLGGFTLSLAAVAFFIGFSVEGVFKLIETLIGSVTSSLQAPQTSPSAALQPFPRIAGFGAPDKPNSSGRRDENSQGLNLELITRAGTMVPFANIPRIEMTSAEIGQQAPQIAAASLDLDRIDTIFKKSNDMRVVIFDDKEIPVFVLRRDAMPPVVAGDTLSKYLMIDVNKSTAHSFVWIARTSTIADGRRLLGSENATDMFVTEHGREDEPVVGWVPDDNLRAAS
jgi:hypothetical protein